MEKHGIDRRSPADQILAMRRPDLSGRPYSLELTEEVAVPPDRVFEAFTGPRLEDWFCAKGSLSMRAEPESPFFFETEFENERHAHYGRLLDLQPARRVEMTWVTQSGTKGAETVLLIDLEPSGRGTRITLRHSGFPDAASRQRHLEAWPDALKLLEKALSEDQPTGQGPDE